MTAYEQRSYPGAAADTLLNADITSGGTSFSVTPGSGTGYPDGSQGPFFVIIDWDNSKAEKIRCSGRVNDTFTVAGTGGGRGQDGTSAQAHTANAKVRAVITATDVQEANRAAANTIGRITSKGDLTPGASANTTTRLAAGPDGAPLVADSTQPGGMRWPTNMSVGSDGALTAPYFRTGLIDSSGASLQIAAPDSTHAAGVFKSGGANSDILQGHDSGGVTVCGFDKSGNVTAPNLTGAWTAYTPGLFNITLGNGTLVGRYLQIGKTVHFKAQLTFGSTTSITATTAIIGLPVAVRTGSGDYAVSGTAFRSSSSGYWQIGGACAAGGTNCSLATASGPLSATAPFTFATGDVITVTGTYESA